MSVALLDKVRKIEKVLRNSGTFCLDVEGLCFTVSSLICSNVYLIGSKKEAVYASSGYTKESFERALHIVPGEEISPSLYSKISEIFSTKENITPSTLGIEGITAQIPGIIVPLNMAGERLGTMLYFRKHDPYDMDEIILAEYAASLITLEFGRLHKKAENEEVRKLAAVKSAIGALSTSELEAACAVLGELPEAGGMLNTSALSEKCHITRSIIINALKKLESAGTVEIRSAGAKGTRIKIKNNLIFAEVLKYSADN